ncbi:MAG: hypothetical protein U0O04_03745 [Clostridia bacterium]|jgi:hypothetical protein
MKILSKEVEKENKKGVDIMYTTQELIKEHLEKKCKGCKIKDCNGITITQSGTTKCTKEE